MTDDLLHFQPLRYPCAFYCCVVSPRVADHAEASFSDFPSVVSYARNGEHPVKVYALYAFVLVYSAARSGQHNAMLSLSFPRKPWTPR